MAEIRNEDLAAKARKTLGTMLDYLGLDAELKVEAQENKLAIKISSREPGRIIGRKGQTLESLQLLLNRIMFKGDDECPRISIDIDGYPEEGGRAARGESDRPRRERGDRGERGDRSERSDRGERGDRSERSDYADGDRPRRDRRERHSGLTEEQLIAQAEDAAKEVKKWGEPVTLPKMNAHDRRIIHITLEKDSELTTASDGDGAMKKVVISLKKD